MCTHTEKLIHSHYPGAKYDLFIKETHKVFFFVSSVPLTHQAAGICDVICE